MNQRTGVGAPRMRAGTPSKASIRLPKKILADIADAYDQLATLADAKLASHK
jgi:hypothetical protein